MIKSSTHNNGWKREIRYNISKVLLYFMVLIDFCSYIFFGVIGFTGSDSVRDFQTTIFMEKH